ncbi:hypothetical protein Tco_0069784, partial [Tanacetum coccineum]
KELITQDILDSEYYGKYIEMAEKKKKAQQVDEPKKPAPAKRLTTAKTPAPAKQSKPSQKKPSKPTQSKKVHKGKRPDRLIDEADEEPQPISLEAFESQGQARQAPVGGVVILDSALVTPRLLPDVQGKGKAISTDEQAVESLLELQKPKRRSIADQFILQRRILRTHDVTLDISTVPSAQPQDDTSANVVHDTPSPTDAETGVEIENSNNEGQTGSDPGRTPGSRAPPEVEDQAGPDPEKSHVALTGPNPEHMHDDFIALVYP